MAGRSHLSAKAVHPTSAEVILRPLSRTQVATRRRLLDAARDLAADAGYDAVNMRRVAERAGLSAPTASQYLPSRARLLVEVVAALAANPPALTQPRPSRRGTPADRAAATLRRVVRRVEEQPNLFVAITRAYISGSAEVAHARGAME